MKWISPPTSRPDRTSTAVERHNRCAICGGPAPVTELGLGPGFPVAIRSRYCDTCLPLVEAEEREQERLRRANLLLSRAGGPRGIRDWSLETYPDDEDGRRVKAEAIEWFQAFLAGDHRNLILFGTVGGGKTGLAWSLVRAACEQTNDALFLNFRDYLWECRQRFAENAPIDETPHWVSLLALDDLGAERPTEWARSELATMIEHRYTSRMPVIVTSNYDLAELGHRLGHDDPLVGHRLVSRLAENSVQIRFTGPDRRARSER